MRGTKSRLWARTSRIGWAVTGLSIATAATISMATPSHASDCPPDRPLCHLFRPTTPTTTPPPAQVVTIPSTPPVTVLPPPPAPAAPRNAPEAAQRLLDLVNAERTKAGMGRLTSRDDVVAIALAHTQRMVASGTIFHNDNYFSDSVQRLLNSKARGENVAQNSSVDDTHTRLMNSPGHRANILDPRFSVVGFAVVQATDGRYYTTQDFLQPAGAVAPVAPAPGPPTPAAPAAPRPVVAASAPVAGVAPTSTAPATTVATPVTVVEVAPAPAADQTTLAGLAIGRRAPAASTGPDLARRHAPTTWVAAAILLAAVALGAGQASRRTRHTRTFVR